MAKFTFEITSETILFDVLRIIEEATEVQFIDVPKDREEEFADDCRDSLEFYFERHGITMRDYLQQIQTIVLDTAETYGYLL